MKMAEDEANMRRLEKEHVRYKPVHRASAEEEIAEWKVCSLDLEDGLTDAYIIITFTLSTMNAGQDRRGQDEGLWGERELLL